MNVATQIVGPGGALNSTGLETDGDAVHELEDSTSQCIPTMLYANGLEWRHWPSSGWDPGLVHLLGEDSTERNWSRIGLAVRLTFGGPSEIQEYIRIDHPPFDDFQTNPKPVAS
jgi:hypothetical protein